MRGEGEEESEGIEEEMHREIMREEKQWEGKQRRIVLEKQREAVG